MCRLGLSIWHSIISIKITKSTVKAVLSRNIQENAQAPSVTNHIQFHLVNPKYKELSQNKDNLMSQIIMKIILNKLCNFLISLSLEFKKFGEVIIAGKFLGKDL